MLNGTITAQNVRPGYKFVFEHYRGVDLAIGFLRRDGKVWTLEVSTDMYKEVAGEYPTVKAALLAIQEVQ